uniref:Enoyl reductase (ER) domain-containing protein n=1 Tax=Moniliophthora roreri TaxID=221103 RepID=A0A0W0G430_MONRR
MSTMKAIVKTSSSKYQLEQIEIPHPGRGEVLVKIAATAQNPADWKNLPMVPVGHVMGYDFSGTVYEMGPDVEGESRYIGERVAGLVHGGAARNGAFAEYVVAQAGLLFHLPDHISFEDGAQLGVACMTACYSLYHHLKFPMPLDSPSSETVPRSLLVWSGSTSVGQVVIQLAKLSGIRVIATASPRQHEFVKSLGADEVYDYSDSFTGRDIFEATDGSLHHAVDCWSEGISPYQVSASLNIKNGRIATLLPYKSRKKGIETSFVFAYAIFGKDTTFPFPSTADLEAARDAREYSKLISRLLAEGNLKLGSIKVYPNGLAGIPDGMEYSRMGKVHGEKIVHRISDTPGLKVD